MKTETVTRLRGTSVLDPYSQLPTATDWSTPSALDILTLAPAQPRPTDEPVEVDRDRSTSGWTLFLPDDADVTRLDRMRVRGVVHEVVGTPEVRSGFALVVETELVAG